MGHGEVRRCVTESEEEEGNAADGSGVFVVGGEWTVKCRNRTSAFLSQGKRAPASGLKGVSPATKLERELRTEVRTSRPVFFRKCEEISNQLQKCKTTISRSRWDLLVIEKFSCYFWVTFVLMSLEKIQTN